MSNYDNLALIKQAWGKYPEVELHVNEIKRASQLPHWKDCKKNAAHIGIIRRKRGDRIIIVAHKIMHELDMRIKFEELEPNELAKYGFFPTTSRYCNECGEFATRINIDGRCQDCNEKYKK